MVISTFKKQIYTTDWEIVNTDPDDEQEYEEEKKQVRDFYQKINKNNDTVEDINSEVITDIAEIDAGVWNLVYTNDSYIMGELPIYNAWGKVIELEPGLVLKELGKRELSQVKGVDGSTMLKQVDIHKTLRNYWQYSFKHPRQNPTRFESEEIIYLMMNNKSYSVYGFSPMQSIQQCVELLVQGTRYNKDLYKNNAIPDLLVSLPKLPDSELKKIKRSWNNQYKGKPHQVGFINWLVENVTKLAENNRDLEWLEGQKWYSKLIFGAYGVSPTEAGFFENSNKSNDEGQERVTVRNALRPYYKLLEDKHTNVIIPEILQRDDVPIKFKFIPKDQVKEKIEFEQDKAKMELGAMTINEYRRKQGQKPVEWGDEPLRKPFDPAESMGFGMNNNGDAKPNEKPETDPEQDKEQNKMFKKKFEVFLSDKQ
jgi:hypothetical protein